MSEHPLRPIFEPRSVGVIGASSNPEKRGHQVVAALQQSGFSGPIVPVHPRGGELLGLDVEKSVAEAQPVPELVYVATPAATGPDVVRECGLAGVKGAIVPAVGYGESGEAGAELQRRLVDAARETGIRVVGPNTSGLLNTHVGLHMVGGEPLAPGGLAIVSQSGNVALDLMTSAASRPIGVSIYVGPGNECDVGFAEIVDFLVDHEPTRAIVMYVEGVADGRALFDVARKARGRKPIVVLKGGRSERGVQAALSHTGSIAGSYRVFQAAARQSGMIEVDASDELLPVGETLATQPAPRTGPDGAGFVILSDGGGHGAIAADRFTAMDVPLARLSAETTRALEDLCGPASSALNPVDVAGASDTNPRLLVRAVEIAASDPACAGVMMIGLFGGYAIRFAESLLGEELEAARELPEVARRAGVPVVVHSLYARRGSEPLRQLLASGTPVHGSLEIATTCCAALWKAGGSEAPRPPIAAAPTIPVDVTATGRRVAAVASDRGWLDEVEARRLVASHGVEVVRGEVCHAEDHVRELIARRSGRWVAKAVSAELPHKTDAGAIVLDVSDTDPAISAFRTCVQAAATAGASLDGVLFTEMLDPPIAELLLGARRDDSFGPILTVGFGGTEAEVAPDAAVRLLPIDASDVEAMLLGLRSAPLLTGFRGGPRADLAAIVQAAIGVAAVLDDPSIVEVELNPVFAYSERVIAVDALARREVEP